MTVLGIQPSELPKMTPLQRQVLVIRYNERAKAAEWKARKAARDAKAAREGRY